jgi:ATP-dependent Clp protease, protease subunit
MSQARKLRRQLVKRAAVVAVAQASQLRAAGASPSSPSPVPLAARRLSARGLSLVEKGKSELCIDGVIGEKNLRASHVREALSALGAKKDITLRLNSVGGSVVEGIAMYQAIRRHEGTVVAYVDGIAASMASVILQAADERHVSRGSYVMIHNPQSPADGEASELRHTAEVLDKIRDDMLDIYEASTGMDREKIAKMMDDETYLTADEAVKMGFADVVDETEARIEARAVAKLSETSKKIPEALRARAAAQAKGQPTMAMTDEEKEEMRALKEENAKLKASAAKAEATAEDDDSEDDDAEDEGDDTPHDEDDDEKDDDKKEAKAVLAAARRLTGKKGLSAVAGTLMALASSTVSVRATEVKELIAAGKLAPKDKAWAMSASDKTFGAYKDAIGKAQIAPIGRVVKQPANPTGEGSDTELTAEEAAYAKATGMSKENIIKARAFSALGKVS